MDVRLYTQSGESAGTVSLNDAVFGVKANADLVYRVATSLMSNQRQVLAHAKTRAEVRGGGKKPWQQKGTGRARHGSIRSPIWVGGGVAHGPSRDVNFKKTIPATQARTAMLAVLSDRIRTGDAIIVDALTLDGTTKQAASAMQKLATAFSGYGTNARKQSRVLVVVASAKESLPVRRALGNIPNVATVTAGDLNALTLLAWPFVVIAQDALAVIEKKDLKN